VLPRVGTRQGDVPAAATVPSPEPAPAFRWFLASLAAWFAAYGLQAVLFSSLVVFYLEADAAWVGVAQGCLMAPSVLFLLVGGAVADRVDRRRLLIGLCLAAAVLSASLLFAVATHLLSLTWLLVFALAMGTVQAFVIPARDSLLSEVVGPNLGRGIAVAMLTQWGMQAVGALLGASARFVGIEVALGFHVVLLVLGVLPLTLLPPSRRVAPAKPAGGRLHELAAGIREVIGSPVLLPPLLLVTAVGLFFIGPFMVVFPVLIRNYYGGGVGELGLVNSSFSVGTILGSFVVLGRGGLRRRGRAQILVLGVSASCIAVVGLGVPYPVALLAVLSWGCFAAVFMNAGRGVFQEHASPAHRGRVLAVYALGFMGSSGLVGAPVFGALVEAVGPLHSCLLAALGALTAAILAALFTDIWNND
jgi:MFS family permease